MICHHKWADVTKVAMITNCNAKLECKLSEPENSREIALQRVLRHREAIVKVNPVKEKENIDKALRATLTYMMTNEEIENIPNGSEVGLRYIKERINIPRDMPIWSARRLREALGVRLKSNVVLGEFLIYLFSRKILLK